MAASFSIQPVGRFAGPSQPVKRPKVSFPLREETRQAAPGTAACRNLTKVDGENRSLLASRTTKTMSSDWTTRR